jgi:hopanoid biosynthesis associated protein HpnK
VNEAVEQAHRAGVLTSASLMVAEDAATDAVERARRMPTLRVGLHLTVVDGRTVLPAEQVRAIVNSGGRLTDRLVRAGCSYFFRPRARRELRGEVRAQLEAFRASGLELDHVDTHRHLLLHPTVLGMIIDFAHEFGIRAIRLPTEPWRATRGLPVWRRVVAAARIVSLGPWLALARWRLRRAGIRYNAEVRGLADTGRMDESTVLRLIRTLNCDITEIFFHPATATPSTEPLAQVVSRHVAELQALCSPRVRNALEGAGVERIGYGDLGT